MPTAHGELPRSLIHTRELTGANPFRHVTELQKHAREAAAAFADWIPGIGGPQTSSPTCRPLPATGVGLLRGESVICGSVVGGAGGRIADTGSLLPAMHAMICQMDVTVSAMLLRTDPTGNGIAGDAETLRAAQIRGEAEIPRRCHDAFACRAFGAQGPLGQRWEQPPPWC